MDITSIIAVVSSICVPLGVLAGWLINKWVTIRKLRREEAIADDNARMTLRNQEEHARLDLRSKEIALYQQPTDRLIAQLQGEVQELKGNISNIQTGSLQKILETIAKEADCQKRLAVQEEINRQQNTLISELHMTVERQDALIQQLQNRVADLEGNKG